MDCLHGVLMHNDEEQGAEHSTEDQYLRFKEVLKTKEESPGPATAEEEFHGILMHGDAERGHLHEESVEVLPEERKQILPVDMNQQMHESMHGAESIDVHDWDTVEDKDVNRNAGDHERVMHGLLMHGDLNQGAHDHDQSETTVEAVGNINAGDHEKVMHGLLMHGDINQGPHDHDATSGNEDLVTNKNAGDHEKLMHGLLMHGDFSQDAHADEETAENTEQVVNRNAGDHEKVMHGLLMHGDINEGAHTHGLEENAQETHLGKTGPADHEGMMHGLLMHGDENHGHDEESETVETSGDIGPKDAGEFLHGVLMHGDSEPGMPHSHEAIQDGNEDSALSGPSTDQLHGILMHGDSEVGHDHSDEDAESKHEVFRDISKILEMNLDQDLLKIIDIEKILKKDIEEYAAWKVNNPEHKDMPKADSTYLDKSLLKDIELMKQRYINRGEDAEDISVNAFDDIPFTAEDANSVLSESAKSGEGEDMRHDLELMGSTEPINARHKINLELQKSKENEL